MNNFLDVEKNAKGKENKRNTIFALYVSSVLFFLFSVFLNGLKINIWFFYLFLAESVGQFFLAIENHITFKSQNYLIKYFNNNLLGKITAAVFLGVVVSRFYLIDSYIDNYYIHLIGIIISFVYVGGIFLLRDKMTLCCGAFIGVTSFGLSLAIFIGGHTALDSLVALNQLFYFILLITGVLFLRPWVAEVLNIFLWTWFFAILLLLS